jgi:hypothetical protein
MAQQPTPPYREIAATHIRALSALSAKLPTFLTTSAQTFSQLTNAPIYSPSSPDEPDTPVRRRAALAAAANDYFTAVQELDIALRIQIKALEDHGVIPPVEVKYSAPVPKRRAPGAEMDAEAVKLAKDSEATVKNSGLGSFDIGHLNARAGAGRQGGEEVLERVKVLLEEMVQQTEQTEPKELKREAEDEDMADG